MIMEDNAFKKEWESQWGQTNNSFFSKEALDSAAKDNGQPYFLTEYLGKPQMVPRIIYELAEECVYRMEKFDRSICGESGIPKGIIEIKLCNQNAREVKKEYYQKCKELKFPKKEFDEIVRNLNHKIDYVMEKYERKTENN